MNQYAILHIPDSRYCFATAKDELVIRLRMSREDEDANVFLVYAQKYNFTFQREKIEMKICYSDSLYHFYEIKMKLKDVRFAYIFEIEKKGETFYYSEDGVSRSYRFEEGFYNFFQMPYINQNDVFEVVDWMRNAVVYQIFVDRFARGNMEKDTGYIDMKWGDAPTPKNFAGGDLRGIIQKLDYLQELGITAIYLTPIFQSISNHKYDISDYMQIDEQFGTKEDLKELVQLAHEKGMKVILDAVFNHCSKNLAQFQDVLKKGKKSEYYTWFLIDGEYPVPEKGNYECFAACTYMPKLNTANESVQDFLIKIALYWMEEAEIDGWRLDVSDEVSHAFWRRFRLEMKARKKDCVIIGENWHDAYPYLMGDQYDSIMNYAFTKACLDYFAKGMLTAEQMAQKLNGILMRNMEQVNVMMLNLLDSHDTHRFFTEVGKKKEKLLAALALEIVYTGTPCIYYGTEVCMEGGYDPDSRRCFPWEEKKEDVTEKIKQLLFLKKREELGYGSVHIHAENEMLCVCRTLQKEEKKRKITLWINMTDKEKNLFQKEDDEKEILCENGYQVKHNRKIFEAGNLQPFGFVIIKEEENTF